MRGLRIPYDSRKTCLMLAISVLVCHVLQANGCMSKALQMYSEYLAGKKPCTDTRRVKIRVGRNPVRYVTVDDYGAHEECSEDDECLPNIKCEEGCCL